jgi:hypothetical protein
VSEKLRFERDPEEGTPTLGVVFYILHKKEIIEATGREPIGYVIEDEDDD